MDADFFPSKLWYGIGAAWRLGDLTLGRNEHLAVDTPGHVVALHVTPADVGDRAEVGRLAAEVQAETGGRVEKAFVDQGHTGDRAAEAAQAHGIELEAIKAPQAKRGFVLLPRRWVVERSFAWATRCRRLVKDYERYGTTLAGFHLIAFVCLMLRQAQRLVTRSYHALGKHAFRRSDYRNLSYYWSSFRRKISKCVYTPILSKAIHLTEVVKRWDKQPAQLEVT